MTVFATNIIINCYILHPYDYINDCWWALHTDNPYWAIRDIYKVCLNNGGFDNESVSRQRHGD